MAAVASNKNKINSSRSRKISMINAKSFKIAASMVTASKAVAPSTASVSAFEKNAASLRKQLNEVEKADFWSIS